MRQRTGIAGATLIYGPQSEPPDLLLASQFLIDDLRRDDRTIKGVRLSRHALRLRAEGFELALALSDAPLPMHAFAGALRPLPDTADTPDLARGRVLHALRSHRRVLGMLMRLRGVQAGQSMEARLQALPGDCHALIGAVAEAAPPMLVVWQASGVICTAGEFQRLPAGMLDAAPGRFSPLGTAMAERPPRARPAMAGPAGQPRVTPRRAVPAQPMRNPAEAEAGEPDAQRPASGPPTEAAPARPGAPGLLSPPARAPAGTAHPSAQLPGHPSAHPSGHALAQAGKGPPASRAARARRLSGGRLFGRKAQAGRVPSAASAGLPRQNHRLARALRHQRPPATAAARAAAAAAAALRIGLACLALALIGPSTAGNEARGIAVTLLPPGGQ